MSFTGGDETYLEAFIESLSTLPLDVKRNLELLKDLDGSCSHGTERLLQLQQEYLKAAEEKLMQVEIVVQHQPQAHSSTTTDPSNDDEDEETYNNEESYSPPAKRRKTGNTFVVGVRVLGKDATDVVIPTTLELEQYVHQQPETYDHIQHLQRDLLQQSDEKVAIAGQLYHRLDITVRRLDKDLADMERLLQTSGDFSSTAVVGKPNDLAACQVTPGSEWILAKVLQHDPTTGMYKLADEDVESNKIFHLPESQVILCGVDKLNKGDVVFCVYPDTTSFYQATVVQAPRKNQGAGSSFVMVNFVDDSDEFGITHDKAVPLKLVIHPPYGSVIK